jgi:hypothetical protein
MAGSFSRRTAQRLKGPTVLILVPMLLVLAILLAFWKLRKGAEHFPSGEISFIWLVFLMLFLMSRL